VAALDRLEAFASFNGPDFYGLPRNRGRLTLEQHDWLTPAAYAYASGDTLVPLRAGEWLRWRLLA
jgi:dihydroorotase